jgi:hypothetical protein
VYAPAILTTTGPVGVDEVVDIEEVNAVVLETAIVDRFPG